MRSPPRNAVWAVVGGAAGMVLGCYSTDWNANVVAGATELVEAVSSPAIAAVIDVGGLEIPLEGGAQIDPRSDGKAVIGEVLWIQGESFGREPVVRVGGVVAAVSSRTRDQGILVRVPPGAPVGTQSVVVSNEQGRAAATITVKRYAAALSPWLGMVAWAEITKDGPIPADFNVVAGARFLRLSSDGRAAYVASASPAVLTVFDMTAPRQPAVARREDLGGPPVRLVTAAAAAPLVALIRDEDVILVDTSSALRPVRSEPRSLPPALRAAHPRRVELGPDGKLLAFAVTERNQVMMIDVKQLGKAGDGAIAATLALEPDVQAPILNDLSFSADGKTLWVVSGDNTESPSVGPLPTRVWAMRPSRQKDGSLKLRLLRVATMVTAVSPTRISSGRGIRPAARTRVRTPPEKATVYVTATAREGERSAVYALGGDNKVQEILVTPGRDRSGGVDLTPDGRLLLAPMLADDGALRAAWAVISGNQAARQPVEVLEAPGRRGAMPSGAGAEIRIQP